MIRQLSAMMFLFGAASLLAQSEKRANEALEVELRFVDGSTMRRVEFLVETMELATKYGKLTIPTREIRRIDFGVHLRPVVEARVQEALRQLGSDGFAQREAATKDLLGLGPEIYPLLARSAKSADLEIVRRATEVMAKMREKYPAEQLQLRLEDVVQTVEFTVSGRLTQSSIKVRTPYFGVQDMQIADLRGLRGQGAGGELEVVVEAAKHGSVRDQYLDTGFEITAGGRVTITASGDVDLWPQGAGSYMTRPNGYQQMARMPNMGNERIPGALVGRVGGKVFFIGERFEGSPGEGTLHLHIIPSPWNNASSGSYKVSVKTAE